MKRVAILAPYVGKIDRGAENFVKELTLALKDFFQIDVYSLEYEEMIKDNIIKVDVSESVLFRIYKKAYLKNRYIRFIINRFYHAIPDVCFQRKFSKACFEIINKREYDLIYPNNGIWGTHFARIYREKCGVPFIYTGHGGIGRGEKIVIEDEPNVYISMTLRQKAWVDGVACGNTSSIVIHNGVKTSDFKHTKKRERKKKTVLTVGALTSFKRHKLTIEAVSKLNDVELIILGMGEEYDSLKQLAEKLIPERYSIESVSYKEVKGYYANADVFCLPSYKEPFGIVYLEAMASNLPIVAPDDSTRREIIGEAGLYCNVEDTNQYAEYIDKALNMNWEDKPLTRVKSFDWSIISNEYRMLIDQVIEKTKKGSLG